MLDIVRNWFRAYFSDEEAVYLFFLLAGGLLVILLFGRMLAPVLAALVLAYLMQGLVSALIRWGLPEKLSVLLVYLLFVSLLVATLVLLLPVIWKQTVNLVQDQLPRILNNSERWLRELPAAYPDMISMRQVDAIVDTAQHQLANAGQAVLSLSLATIPSIVDVMIFLVLVPLLVFFFLADRKRLIDWSTTMLPNRRRVLANVWAEMDQQIANYVRGKAIEILIVGVVTYIAFKILGLNYALLLAVLVAMLAFAVTNRIAIGGAVIAELALPAFVQRAADLLRASERFFWPLAYAVLFGAIAAVAARWGGRRAGLVLAAALALQLADISVGLARFRALVADAPRVPVERLADPFWAEAAQRYQRIRAVPAGNFGANWEEIARFAATHGLATDAVYHSRIDHDALRTLRMAVAAELAAARWEAGTLYVLRDEATHATVAARYDPARDLLREADGMVVFAPGWHTR